MSDNILSVGIYQHAKLIMHDLDATFKYNFGTAVMLCGWLLKYKVPFLGNDDCFCLAHFMKESMLCHLSVLESSVRWATQEEIHKFIGDSNVHAEKDTVVSTTAI
jgi:hypothetical protein